MMALGCHGTVTAAPGVPGGAIPNLALEKRSSDRNRRRRRRALYQLHGERRARRRHRASRFKGGNRKLPPVVVADKATVAGNAIRARRARRNLPGRQGAEDESWSAFDVLPLTVV
jgi:hypothetical protein